MKGSGYNDLAQVARAPLTLEGSAELSALHGPEHTGRNARSDLGGSRWLEWTAASCSHVYAVLSLLHMGGIPSVPDAPPP